MGPASETDRSSGRGARVQYLDGWRGLSILLVLIGHFVPDRERLAGLGLQMFFALSGRLMAEILFVEKSRLVEFYRRRLARIYPGLLAFVLLAWIFLRPTSLRIDWASVAAALSFTLNYRLASGHAAAPIENLWSLCIEEHAYILLGAVAFLLGRRKINPVWPLLAVAAISIADGLVSLFVFHQSGPAAYWRTDTELAPIFLAAAAFLALRERPAPRWAPLAAALAAIASLTAPVAGRYFLTPMFLAAAMATLDRAPPPIHRALSWRPLRLLGVASYSIYLWQHPLYRFALDGQTPPVAALLGALVLGTLSFLLIEQPARRGLNRIRFGLLEGWGAAPLKSSDRASVRS